MIPLYSPDSGSSTLEVVAPPKEVCGRGVREGSASTALIVYEWEKKTVYRQALQG